jgi:hypothetical protein
MGNQEGKRSLGRPRHRWEGNIKMDLKDSLGWYGLDSYGPGKGPMVGSCEHGNEKKNSKSFQFSVCSDNYYRHFTQRSIQFSAQVWSGTQYLSE